MQFSLTGFSQSTNVRFFAFQGMAADQRRQLFTVGVDLDLARQYAISLQDLPLLCRQFLEEQAAGELHSLTFSERDMLVVVNRRTEAKPGSGRKPRPSRHPSSDVGQA